MENTGKRKPGRPRKVKTTPKPTPTPSMSKEQYYENWVMNNRNLFFSTRKKTKEEINMVYEIYNYLFKSNKTPGKCGICSQNIIFELKYHFFK